MAAIERAIREANRPAMRWLDFKLIGLQAGESQRMQHTGHEAAVVLLNGRCTIDVDGQRYTLRRTSVFEERASAVYVPPETAYAIAAAEPTEVAVCLAASTRLTKPAFVGPEQVRVRTVGRERFERQVVDIIDARIDAGRLLVGETLNPPGQWSSFPPHKHDRAVPNEEVDLEEIYFFRVHPPEGFGFQRLYTAGGDRDEALVITNDTLVRIPSGYHPVCAMPGYWLYYLWFLAGDGRTLLPCTDPAFRWLD